MGAAVLVVGGALAFGERAPTQRPACPDPRTRLAGIWDDGAKARLQTGLTASAPAIAATTLSRIVPALDTYADAWRSTQIASCQATHVHRTQSPEALDRRELCLERRLASLRSLTSLLQAPASPSVIVRADEAVADLPAIHDCESNKGLLAQPLPSSPTARAQIESIERDLEKVQEMRWSNKQRERLDGARRAVEAARSVGYAPLLARSLIALSDAEAANSVDSAATLRELARVAAEAQDDHLVAMAWIRLLNVLSSSKDNHADARALVPVAEAAVSRAGGTNELRFRLSMAKGGLAMKTESFEEATREFATARSLASDVQQRVLAHEYEAKFAFITRGPAAAIPVAEEALRVMREAYGTTHPITAKMLDVLAQAHVTLGDFDRAEAHAREAIAINEAVFGDRFPENTAPLRVLGYVASLRGQKAAAKEFAMKAVSIAETQGRPERLAAALQTLGNAIHEADGAEAALPVLERGLATIEAALGREHESYVMIENDLASKQAGANRCRDAMAHLDHAIAYLETRPRPERVAMPLVVRGDCEKAAKRLDAAIESYERALAICRAHRCDPNHDGAAMGSLGQLLIESRRDRARGIELMHQARALFLSKGMKGYADETDRNMRRVGVRPRPR